MQTCSRNLPKPQVVITRRHEDISTWSQQLWHSFLAHPIHFHLQRHRPTTENTIRYKPEVETVTQTGSTNNLATETVIDSIAVAVPMFWGKIFTYVYVNLAQRLIHPEIPRWRSCTGSSYNFANENDIKVISAAAAMFQGTFDPPTPAIQHRYCSTRDNTIKCKPEVETVPATETDIDAISVATQT